MEGADFSGYASKSGLLCTDGRTINSGAFKDNDKQKVPLVWSHQYDGVSNVLGHAYLEDRDDGVYAYGFFNDSEMGRDAKIAVQHGDIEALSIFANNLVHQGTNVVHGVIREVSLVLAGANPGAFIDNVRLAHGDGFQELDTEAKIFFPTEMAELKISGLSHSDMSGDEEIDLDELNFDEVVHSMTPTQQAVAHALISGALGHADSDDTEGGTVADNDTESGEKTVDDILASLNPEQKGVFDFMLGEALKQGAGEDEDNKDDKSEDNKDDDKSDDDLNHSQFNTKGTDMGRNTFDQANGNAGGGAGQPTTLSHSQLSTIVNDAENKYKSLEDSFLAHAQDYGITDIELLFPDAKTLYNTPDFLSRRTEWVAKVLGGTKHSPFSRIKSIVADITADEARAKGYVKGNLKKNEIIKLLKRVTTPKTIYKKQKLDRDDIIDITDIDVVVWLKQEMRLMLDEELARAILIGDGREADDEDKIDEDHIRPIASDVDMYTTQVEIAPELSPNDYIKSFIRARSSYKGTGTPTLYTTDPVLTDMLLIEDKIGRRIYDTEQQLAQALRVKEIVPVEVLEDSPEIIGIVVNLQDYTVGTDQGGNVTMFEDFDIDYNQQKYLIETRVSGALTKPKSAVVLRTTAGSVVVAGSPSFNADTNEITIPTTTGVVYSIDGQDKAAGSKVVIDETSEVEARAAAGYKISPNSTTSWTFAV